MINGITRVPFSLAAQPLAYKHTGEDLREIADERRGFENAEFEAEMNAEVVPERIEAVEDSDVSLEAFAIDPEDSIFLTCRSGDCGAMDMVVYNPIHEEFVLHHSIMLPYYPLAGIPVNFQHLGDPNGNVVKQSTVYGIACGLSPEIEVYDLNEMDQIKPNYIMAQSKTIRKTGQQIPSPQAHHGGIVSASWSDAHPNVLLTAGEDGAIKFWDLQTLDLLTTLQISQNVVNIIEFIPNHPQAFISCDIAGVLRVFDFTVKQDGPVRELVLGHAPEQMRFLETDQVPLVIVSTEDGSLLVINYAELKIVSVTKTCEESIPLTALSIHGRIVACGSAESNQVMLFEICDDLTLRPLTNFVAEGKVFSLEFGRGLSGFILLVGMDCNAIKAFNFARRLNPDDCQRLLQIQHDQVTRYRDHYLKLDGDNDGGDEEEDVIDKPAPMPKPAPKDLPKKQQGPKHAPMGSKRHGRK